MRHTNAEKTTDSLAHPLSDRQSDSEASAPASPARLAHLDARVIRQLQRTAGNAAVAELAQRRNGPVPAGERPAVQRAFQGDIQNMTYTAVHGELVASYDGVPAAWKVQQLMNSATVYRTVGEVAAALGLSIAARAKAGTSSHPTLTRGAANNPEAVMEAQQKLATSPGGSPALVADGILGPLTEAAIKAFQVKKKLADSGIVDKATWDLLDASGKSSVGRVERQWDQTMVPGGAGVPSYVTGMTSKYSYNIDATKILISVGINFVSDPIHPPADLGKVTDKWKARILGRWNLFKAVKSDGTASRDIVFAIVPSGGNTVNVTAEQTGSDAGNWSVPDNENDNGPSHEFGHMIGLEDEYQRDIDAYTRTHTESSKGDVAKAKGGFFGGDQYTDEVGMMGTGALSAHDDKTADPEPRHVREFSGFVEKFLGGKWEAKPK